MDRENKNSANFKYGDLDNKEVFLLFQSLTEQVLN